MPEPALSAWSSVGHTPGSSDTELNPLGHYTKSKFVQDPRIGIDFVLAYVSCITLIFKITCFSLWQG